MLLRREERIDAHLVEHRCEVTEKVHVVGNRSGMKVP